MLAKKYVEKARSIIDASRSNGTRTDVANLLSLESINLALAETLATIGMDEESFNKQYEQSLPEARSKLVSEFLVLASKEGIADTVDYRAVIQALKMNEANGGRGVYEPRTVMGESKLIATVLGIIAANGDVASGQVEEYVNANMEQIFQNLLFALEEF